MAYTFSTGNTPATGAVAMWTLINTMVSAGWLVKADSDGSTYNATGGQVTGGASGAHGLGNNSAWVRIQSPLVGGNTRELTIQRGTTDVIWRLKYSCNKKFSGGAPAATVTPSNQQIDQYPETNQDGYTALRTGSTVGAGQSFTGDGYALSLCRMYVKKSGSPTGTAVVKIYAHSGSFGTTSIPTGTALATSDNFDVSALTTSFVINNFTFSGINQITLANGTNYVLSVEYSGGSVGNTVDVGKDGSSPTHSGNSATWDGATWTAVNTSDLCFYLYDTQADEVFMLGAGTDATPTFTPATWFAANGGYRWHVACGGAAEFYSFYAIALTSTTTTALNAICLDVMQAGSYAATDVDPAVMYCSSAATGGISEVMTTAFASANVTAPAKARAWLGSVSFSGANTAATVTNNVNVMMSSLGSGTTKFGAGQSLAVNPFTGNDDMISAFWGRSPVQATPPCGIKGYSTLFMMGSMGRTNMDTATTAATKDKVYYGTVWMPWDGTTPTL